MEAADCIELPVLCSLVSVRRANPFHWALLRALQVFPAGQRPELEELAIRLRIGEVAFLSEAWRELLAHHAADDADFGQASITLEGLEALRLDHLPTGSSEERLLTLLFSADGKLLQASRAERQGEPQPLSEPPSWADALTADFVANSLERVGDGNAPGPDERLRSISPRWERAQLQAVCLSQSG